MADTGMTAAQIDRVAYLVAKDPEAAARIRKIINENRPNANARFVDMTLSETGLQVSRS